MKLKYKSQRYYPIFRQYTIKTPITLEHAFDLSKNLMDLVITVERISNRIPGVGGTIRYGVVAAGGFKYIDGRTDVLNIT